MTEPRPAAILRAGGGLWVTESLAKAVLSVSVCVYGEACSRGRRVLVGGPPPR